MGQHHLADSPVANGADGIIIPAVMPDGSLRPVGKLQAHREGLLHLAVSVFVFDGDDMLIQRRASHKYHCGGLWANTCCTHPHWGESAADCANRRLGEELGLAVPLVAKDEIEYRADVGNGLIEHERVTVFVGQTKRAETALDLDPAEVMETRWASRTQLRDELVRYPERFTPWFRIYADRFSGFNFPL